MLVRRFLAGAEYEPPAQTDDLDGLRAELADAEEELRELVESKEPISPAVLAARGRVLEVRVAEAQAQLATYLFSTSDVNRVEASTDVENAAEQRSLEKAGFMREGMQRGAQFRAGAYHDLLTFSRLRNDPT